MRLRDGKVLLGLATRYASKSCRAQLGQEAAGQLQTCTTTLQRPIQTEAVARQVGSFITWYPGPARISVLLESVY